MLDDLRTHPALEAAPAHMLDEIPVLDWTAKWRLHLEAWQDKPEEEKRVEQRRASARHYAKRRAFDAPAAADGY